MKTIAQLYEFLYGWWFRHVKRPEIAAKERVLRRWAQKSGCEVFIETGCHNGDMVAAMQPYFRSCFTCDIDPQMTSMVSRRLHGVAILTMPSVEFLPLILSPIMEPCMFWLDAHDANYKIPEDTPLYSELRIILEHRADHTILIDDFPAHFWPIIIFARHYRPEICGHVESGIIILQQGRA